MANDALAKKSHPTTALASPTNGIPEVMKFVPLTNISAKTHSVPAKTAARKDHAARSALLPSLQRHESPSQKRSRIPGNSLRARTVIFDSSISPLSRTSGTGGFAWPAPPDTLRRK